MEIFIAQRNEQTLAITFNKFNTVDIAKIKKIEGKRWIPKEGIWTLPYTIKHVVELLNIYHEETFHVESGLAKECRLLEERVNAQNNFVLYKDLSAKSVDLYQEQLFKNELSLRGYSSKTIKAYCGQVERFFFYTQKQSVFDEKMIKSYTLYLLQKKCSHAYINQAISAIKFYNQKILHLDDAVSYVRPKKEKKLPNVLSLNEVMSLLKATQNLKHKAILYLTYSSGLRVGEVVRLRLQDIDKDRKTLHIRQGKGRKDRITLLSDAAYEIVQKYMGQQKLEVWLFPGQIIGRHLTERSVQKTFEQALRLSGLEKKVSVHSLRHSFATHLLEGGIDIRYIQELLGHQSSRTTELHTHVSVRDVRRIKSPLDQMSE
jgi:integrase/recombinase XerD